MNDQFYHGRQEDASELLQRVLLDSDVSSTLASLLHWDLNVSKICKSCQCRYAPKSEPLTTLSLSLESIRLQVGETVCQMNEDGGVVRDMESLQTIALFQSSRAG